MQIYSLILFLAVVDYISFSQAAIEKNISQSSLSKHIKNLEDEVGVKLFDRKSHQIKLTGAGSVFVPYAEKLVDDYYGLKNTMEQFTDSERGFLRIVACPVLHLYNLSGLIMDFRLARPNIRLQLIESPTASIIKEIERQNYDLAFVRSTVFPKKDNYIFYHLVDDELYFICNKKHRFAERKEVSFYEINQDPFVLLKPGIYEYMIELRKLGIDFDLERNSIVIHNVNLLADYVLKNDYISLLMGNMAEQMCETTDLVAIPLAEHPKFPLEIAVDIRNKSKLGKDFINFAISFYKGK